jgi:hypothetical protein
MMHKQNVSRSLFGLIARAGIVTRVRVDLFHLKQLIVAPHAKPYHI